MSCGLTSSAEMIAMQARIFDSIRPGTARLFLLKHAQDSSRLVAVREIAAGWFVTFNNEFRDELTVSIATDGSLFPDHTAQSSYLAYGIPDEAAEMDVFSFDKKDATRPNATSPSWKIHCYRASEKRFVVSDGEIPRDEMILPYKIYSAYFEQTGADAPVVTVMQNTVGDLEWTRHASGYYRASLPEAFPPDKSVGFATGDCFDQPGGFSVLRADDDSMLLKTPGDNNKGFVEIRVYD